MWRDSRAPTFSFAERVIHIATMWGDSRAPTSFKERAHLECLCLARSVLANKNSINQLMSKKTWQLSFFVRSSSLMQASFQHDLLRTKKSRDWHLYSFCSSLVFPNFSFAESEGFEPPVQRNVYTAFRVRLFRPLRQLSSIAGAKVQQFFELSKIFAIFCKKITIRARAR